MTTTKLYFHDELIKNLADGYLDLSEEYKKIYCLKFQKEIMDSSEDVAVRFEGEGGTSETFMKSWLAQELKLEKGRITLRDRRVERQHQFPVSKIVFFIPSAVTQFSSRFSSSTVTVVRYYTIEEAADDVPTLQWEDFAQVPFASSLSVEQHGSLAEALASISAPVRAPASGRQLFWNLGSKLLSWKGRKAPGEREVEAIRPAGAQVLFVRTAAAPPSVIESTPEKERLFAQFMSPDFVDDTGNLQSLSNFVSRMDYSAIRYPHVSLVQSEGWGKSRICEQLLHHHPGLFICFQESGDEENFPCASLWSAVFQRFYEQNADSNCLTGDVTHFVMSFFAACLLLVIHMLENPVQDEVYFQLLKEHLEKAGNPQNDGEKSYRYKVALAEFALTMAVRRQLDPRNLRELGRCFVFFFRKYVSGSQEWYYLKQQVKELKAIESNLANDKSGALSSLGAFRDRIMRYVNAKAAVEKATFRKLDPVAKQVGHLNTYILENFAVPGRRAAVLVFDGCELLLRVKTPAGKFPFQLMHAAICRLPDDTRLLSIFSGTEACLADLEIERYRNTCYYPVQGFQHLPPIILLPESDIGALPPPKTAGEAHALICSHQDGKSAEAEEYMSTRLSKYGRPLFGVSEASPVKLALEKLQQAHKGLPSGEEEYARTIACIGLTCFVNVSSAGSLAKIIAKSFMGTVFSADLEDRPVPNVSFVSEPVLALAANHVLFGEGGFDLAAKYLHRAVVEWQVEQGAAGGILGRLLLMQAAHESEDEPVYRSTPLSEWLSRLLVGENVAGVFERNYSGHLVNFVQFSCLYEGKKLDCRYLLESMARATAVITPPNFAGYNVIIPVAAKCDRVLYAGVQFHDCLSDYSPSVAGAFDSMLSVDKQLELKGMTSVLGIFVQLCGQDDAYIGEGTDEADKDVACELEGKAATYSLVGMSPCTRVRVYTVKETGASASRSASKRKKTAPEPHFVSVIGLAAFKSLGGLGTRNLFMSVLSSRVSPSQAAQHVRISSERYAVEKKLYGDQLLETIRSSTRYSYGQKYEPRSQPFHAAREAEKIHVEEQ